MMTVKIVAVPKYREKLSCCISIWKLSINVIIHLFSSNPFKEGFYLCDDHEISAIMNGISI